MTLAAAVAVATAVTAVGALPAVATVGQPGTVDTTFNTPLLSGGVGSIAVQQDGKLIIVGNFENLGPNHIGYVARLNSDGSLDTSFVPPIFGFNGVPRTAAVLPSGDIVVAGGFTDYRVGVGPLQIANKILKLSSTGAVKPFPAPSFGPFGIGEINTLAIDPINYYPSPPRIMVGGTFASVGGDGSYRAFASLIEGGSLDATPKIGFTGGSDSVRAIVTRPSGYLVGGQFQSPYGGIDHGITRTILDGSHDNTFVPPNIDGSVESIDVASNGKILVGGAFSNVGSSTGDNLVRLNPNGSYDPTFVPPAFDAAPKSVKFLPDGKVIAAGWFTSVGGDATRNSIVRLNADGSRDTTFNPPTFTGSASPWATSVALTAGDKIVVGGFFENLGGDPTRDRLARLDGGELAAKVPTAQSVTTVAKLRVGKRKKLPAVTQQGVPVAWKSLTKSRCVIKSGKLVAVRRGTCKVRATAAGTVDYLALSQILKVKIVN
ncbi:MAG: delta-60 repeat domain-containing protein [Actinomycetes bacterium]